MKEPTFEHEYEQTAFDALTADVRELGQESHWKAFSFGRQQFMYLEAIKHAEQIAPILNRLIAARRREVRRASLGVRN